MINDTQNVLVLIPAYDPDERLIDITKELLDNSFKVIVIDDGSKSSCKPIFEKVESLGADLVTHAVNQGKGRALKTGFNYILLHYSNYTGVVTADADGQHCLENIISVAQKLDDDPTHLVLGVRDFESMQKDIPLKNRLGNIITGRIFSFLSGVKLKDTQTGLRGIPMGLAAKLLGVEGERYQYEMYMLLDAEAFGYSIVQVPIRAIYIDNNASSHFNPLVDSVKIYLVFAKFVGTSISSFAIDYALFTLLMLNLGWLIAVPLSFFNIEYTLSAALTSFVSVAVARVVSTIFNFHINRKVVFKNKGGLLGSMTKYLMLVVVIIGLSYLLMNVITALTTLSLFVTKPLVDGLLFILSYYVQRRFIFTNTKTI